MPFVTLCVIHSAPRQALKIGRGASGNACPCGAEARSVEPDSGQKSPRNVST
ncbi:DUF1534 domain-containing protein [Pseudomonas syringae]|uniref:DUF1534 domain-containing protein n=1 Tax=Pseudomonas syringae TaxID=317 RepID=A0A9Q4FIW4_PSESX|nr:DUF1534 domain-containing protein [Pseudomonas syringae]MCF5475589.1 DUF1534 domain-containing protein [Pseudomonas syringae]MCF5485481.1 DUF1534 domain-containing protein [Pseudomonas syringae]MCF5489921.1 DUF1534 domain-containing protein [Pseudomonas syringae]MCF5493742.1 DUF1534 domain-containing protein [Pseudomonas syringae]